MRGFLAREASSPSRSAPLRVGYCWRPSAHGRSGLGFSPRAGPDTRPRRAPRSRASLPCLRAAHARRSRALAPRQDPRVRDRGRVRARSDRPGGKSRTLRSQALGPGSCGRQHRSLGCAPLRGHRQSRGRTTASAALDDVGSFLPAHRVRLEDGHGARLPETTEHLVHHAADERHRHPPPRASAAERHRRGRPRRSASRRRRGRRRAASPAPSLRVSAQTATRLPGLPSRPPTLPECRPLQPRSLGGIQGEHHDGCASDRRTTLHVRPVPPKMSLPFVPPGIEQGCELFGYWV